MARLQSLQVIAPASMRRSPAVTSYGHADDHFQLVATIAHRLDPEARTDEARACLSPRSSWNERLDALVRLSLKKPAALDIIDIDALDVRPDHDRERWADLHLREERAFFLRELVSLAARSGWRLLRPAPSPGTSDILRQVGVDHRVAPEQEGRIDDRLLQVVVQTVAPEARPIVWWLLDRAIVDPPSLRRLLDDAGDAGGATNTRLIVGMAYDALPASVRETALALCTIREEVPLNGVVGPLRQDAASRIDLDGRRVPHRHVSKLLECGFLQRHRSGGGSSVRMPRSVRQFLEPRAWGRNPAQARRAHAIMVTREGPDAESAEHIVSRHWHAVNSGDVRAAVDSARFYVSDLRLLAYRLSTEERRFADAADLYRRVVEADDQDAYAWEYLGYNLARAARNHQCDQPVRDEITHALKRAASLDPTNPLYRGRLLGHLGRCGTDITDAFGRWLTRFFGMYHTAGITWFVEPVLRELQAGQARKQLQRIVEDWKPLLRPHERLHRYFPT